MPPANTNPTNANQPTLSFPGKLLLAGIAVLGSAYMLTAAARHYGPINFRNPNSLLERIVGTEKAPATEAPKSISKSVYSIDKDYNIKFCDNTVWSCENKDEDIAREFARQSDSIISCFPPTGTNQDFARQLRAIYGPKIISRCYLTRQDLNLPPKPVEEPKPDKNIHYRVTN